MANIYKFSNEDINKFCSMLRKGSCPYEYMNTWERFKERSLPDKKELYRDTKIETLQVLIISPLKRMKKLRNERS